MPDKYKSIGYNKAIELMRRSDTRLVKMYTQESPDGFFSHYVIPGGGRDGGKRSGMASSK